MFNPSAFQVWVGKVQSIDLSYTPSGTARVNLTMRYPQRSRVEEDGEFVWKTVSNFSPFLTAWGGSAESLANLVKKGMTLSVVTSYKREKVEQDDGSNKYYENYTVESWSIADWHAEEGAETVGSGSEESYDEFNADEDIPF